MAKIVLMPKMNLVMEEGYLGQWYKSVGDVVSQNEPLCSIENEKETGDLLALDAGVLLHIWGVEGDYYKINTPIALIGEADEDISEVVTNVQEQFFNKSAVRESIIKKKSEAEDKSDNKASKIKMLPKLRKIIQNKGIDIEELIAFTGKNRVTEKDILYFEAACLSSKSISISNGRRVRMSPMRRTIAGNMLLSCEKTAQLTNVTEVDMTDAMSLYNLLKKDKNLSVTALIIKACALALREFEIVNASIDGDEIVYHSNINISCAVDVPNGLVVPVIQNADVKDVHTITTEIIDFVERGKNNKLTKLDMTGGTFTVSNVGMLGVELFTPILNYPQAAVMGIGTISRLPRYLNENSKDLVPRYIMKLSLTYDHRIVDGAPAARYSLKVRELLENPDLLLEKGIEK